jgi:CDP-glucose 4,6-dehydratase
LSESPGHRSSSWSRRRVLVTGADGFVGAHLAKALLDRGACVDALVPRLPDAPTSGLRTWGILDRVTLHVADVRDPGSVEEAIHMARPGWIFHLAARTIVTAAECRVQDTYETNVRGTYNVVTAASLLDDLHAVVVASSDKAYGDAKGLPYREGMPLLGGAVYDSSKAAADLLARSAATALQLPVGVTRCSNIFGPGDYHFTRIVPDACRALSRGEPPIVRGDGRHKRDFLFVDDAVEGYIRLGEYLAERRGGHPAIFNFGTGFSVAIRDLVRRLVELSARPDLRAQIRSEATPVEIREQCVDISLARRELAWVGETSLDDGLRRTLDWYQHAHL